MFFFFFPFLLALQIVVSTALHFRSLRLLRFDDDRYEIWELTFLLPVAFKCGVEVLMYVYNGPYNDQNFKKAEFTYIFVSKLFSFSHPPISALYLTSPPLPLLDCIASHHHPKKQKQQFIKSFACLTIFVGTSLDQIQFRGQLGCICFCIWLQIDDRGTMTTIYRTQ